MRSPAAAGVGGERREVTVMFPDIEGFSRMSEDIAPELDEHHVEHACRSALLPRPPVVAWRPSGTAAGVRCFARGSACTQDRP